MNSLHETLVAALRNSGVAGIAWGETGSPYYQQVPEPPPAFPYVVFDIPDSEVVHETDDNYRELYKPEITIVAEEPTIHALSSPYSLFSVLHFLDQMRNSPQLLNGQNFEVIQFLRLNYRVYRADDARSPEGGRVWLASAVYDTILSGGNS